MSSTKAMVGLTTFLVKPDSEPIGFTGGAISMLYDGTRVTTSTIVSRNYDSWSFDRIEVLKGPTSPVSGIGRDEQDRPPWPERRLTGGDQIAAAARQAREERVSPQQRDGAREAVIEGDPVDVIVQFVPHVAERHRAADAGDDDQALPNEVPLDEMNPATSASRLERAWRQASQKMFAAWPAVPDAPDPNLLNRAIWYNAHRFRSTLSWRPPRTVAGGGPAANDKTRTDIVTVHD
jgi:hypothetical protein